MRERSRAVGGLAALAAIAAISACSPVARHERPAPIEPEVWVSTSDGVTSTNVVSDLSRWWNHLADPVLTALIEQALTDSHDVRTAIARLREARARLDAAAAQRAPSVGAGTSVGLSQNTVEADGLPALRYAASIDASWEADLFGGIRGSVEAARADVDAVEASLGAVQVAVAAEVARLYIELRRLQQLHALADESVDLLEELLELAILRRQAGITDELDELRIRTSIEQSRTQILSLDETIAATSLALDILLGAPPGTARTRIADSTGLPSAPDTIAIGIPIDTLRRRPDVQAAERRAYAELVRIDVAEAARLPSLRLSGSVGTEALTRISADTVAGAGYSLLAGLTAPLFEGGRLRALVAQQDAIAEQAWVAYESTVLNALAEVEQALVALHSARERQTILEAIGDEAEAASVLATARFDAGIDDVGGVLDAANERIAVQRDTIESQGDELLAVVRLYRALGGGWSGGDSAEHGEHGQ